jgi:hypothetical protein
MQDKAKKESKKKKKKNRAGGARERAMHSARKKKNHFTYFPGRNVRGLHDVGKHVLVKNKRSSARASLRTPASHRGGALTRSSAWMGTFLLNVTYGRAR